MSESESPRGLQSDLVQRLGIRYPVFQAGMDQLAGPDLAAAVSNAGGLGVLGAGGLEPEEIQEYIDRTRALTDRPFGIDTLLPPKIEDRGGVDVVKHDIPSEYWEVAESLRKKYDLPEVPNWRGRQPPLTREFTASQISVIARNHIAVYVSGLGSPGPYVDELHAAGTTVMALVGSVEQAVKVVEEGVDVVIVQGHEAGGHNSREALFPLLPAVVDAIQNRVPVLAGGGIVDARGMAAATALGASGVWVGTRFLITQEAQIPESLKLYMSGQTGAKRDTVISRYRTGKPVRMLRAQVLEDFAASGLPPLPMPMMSLVTGPLLVGAMQIERYDLSGFPASQAIRSINDILPAHEVVARLIGGDAAR